MNPNKLSVQELSTTENRRSLEEYRRFITTDSGILNTLLLDLIHQRPYPHQRRTTARAVSLRLLQRAEDLSLLLQTHDSSLTTIDMPEESTDNDSTATEQFEQLGDTSVNAFRAAIRREAVDLAVFDLESLGNISVETSNFRDSDVVSPSTDRFIVDSILRRHWSTVLHCNLESFSEQVRLSLALRRNREHE
jgi:hypothetical protein